jgi:hypothetical protein
MSEQTAITRSTNVIQTFDDAERAAKAMAGSGFFQDARQASQAIVKILAGQELGFGPFASMTGVHIIKEKPVLAANLMAAAVKRSGKYNYRVVKHDDTICHLEFFENWNGKWEKQGDSIFTIEDAKRAGVYDSNANWRKYPRNQLFARAMSNGQKWYAPDAFNGATVYTPDELGAIEDADGGVIVQPEPAQIVEGHAVEVKTAPVIPTASPDRPYAAETLQKKIQTTIKAAALDGKTTVQDVERKILAAALGKIFPDNTQRYELAEYLTGTASTKKMAAEAVYALLKWLGNGKAEHVNFDYAPDEVIRKEAHAAHAAALIAKGQQTLI